MSWFEEVLAAGGQGNYQTYSENQNEGGYEGPPGGAPPASAPPSAPPTGSQPPPPASTPGVGAHAWHNTPQGQQLINGFKTTYKSIFKRDATPAELWEHFLSYDKMPSSQFYQDIITNLRNAHAQQNPAPAPGAANSSSGGLAPGQSFRDWFMAQVKGKPYTQQTLRDLEGALQSVGSKLTPANASGEQTKIWDPIAKDWIRVYGVEGSWESTWVPQNWGENGPQSEGPGFGALIAPYEEPFEHPPFVPPPDFVAPDPSKIFDDPGVKFRLEEGGKAIDRAAAGRGTLLTGGTARAQQTFAQDYVSGEYQNLYNRALTEDQLRYGRETSEYERDYNKALGEFQQRFNIFQTNQGNAYNRLAGLAGFGQNAINNLSGGGLNTANAFGNMLMAGANNSGNYLTQAANAIGAGQAGAANAYGNLFGNMNNWLSMYLGSKFFNRPAGAAA